MSLAQLAQGYGLAGRAEPARKILYQIQELSRTRYVTPYHLA
jgi:hypothetical protein